MSANNRLHATGYAGARTGTLGAMANTPGPPSKSLAQLLTEQLVGPDGLSQIDSALASMREAFAKFLRERPNFFDNLQRFVEEFKDLPERQREVWSQAALLGWYPNSETSIGMKLEVAKAQSELDRYMLEQLRADWPLLTKEILSAHPARSKVLECAFELHNEGRYIASVPLFLAQADGICAQMIGAHLFTDNEQREAKLAQMSASSDAFTGTLLGLLGLKTQFSAGIGKASSKHKM